MILFKSKIGFTDLKVLQPWIIAFLFTVFSGAIRKWGISFGVVSNLFLGIQLLIPLFLLFQQRHFVSHFSRIRVFQLYVLFLAFLAAHPLNLTIFHGILGFLLYTTVWFILFAYLKTEKNLPVEKLDTMIWIVLIIQLVLSYFQYNLPGDHFININSKGEDSTSTVGGAVRASGTFSYLGGLQGFMVFWGFFSWYTLLQNKNTWISLLVVIGGFVCSLFTGARGVMINYLGILLLGLISSGFLAKHFLKILGCVAVAGLIYLFFPRLAIFDTVEESYDNFESRYDRGVETGEMDRRIEDQFWGAFHYHGDHPIFGVGLGSTYQGATALFGTSPYITEYGYLEGEGERIVVEGGYVLYFYRLFIFMLFLMVLRMPIWCKIFIFLLFSNAMITFNIFMAAFFAFGLIWTDRAYILFKPKNKPAVLK